MIFFFSFFHPCSKREVNKKVLKVPSIEQKVSPFYFGIIFDVHQPSFNLYTCWMTPANVWDLFEAMCFWKPGWINKIFFFFVQKYVSLIYFFDFLFLFFLSLVIFISRASNIFLMYFYLSLDLGNTYNWLGVYCVIHLLVIKWLLKFACVAWWHLLSNSGSSLERTRLVCLLFSFSFINWLKGTHKMP